MTKNILKTCFVLVVFGLFTPFAIVGGMYDGAYAMVEVCGNALKKIWGVK